MTLNTLAMTLTPDDFHYDTMGTTEDVTRYVPGGYHPIVVGDILGDSPQHQYRIMHKLGWGPYATLWLAQTTDETGAFVSVKITTADDDDAQTHEVEMLRKAARARQESQSHVVKLLDYFRLHGPNGTHTVIVTDIVVPILSLPPKRPPAWRKMVAYGLAQAMAQLHSNGIIHGDWHLGNIGIAVPQLAHQDPDDVMQDLSTHDLTVVLTCDPAKQIPSLPAYLIAPCNIAAYYQKIAGSDPPQVKVFDFGGAHEIGTRSRKFQCALEVCAPEIVYARIFEKIDNPPLNPSADIWALGATIYEIVTGSVIFHGVDMTGLPFRMMKLAGCIPPHWEKWSVSLSDRKITQGDAEEWWASRWEMLHRGCEDEADANALIQLLKRMLVLDPAERPTAAQIVNDPWFQTVPVTNAPALIPACDNSLASALGSDGFHYGTIELFNEDPSRYVPGGYHPTVVGDILGRSHQRQYRIMHKLGWGSYATVWLAQRTDETGAFVSVKITTADDDATQTQEVEMLQKAARVQPDNESQSHVVKLLDHFRLHSPNGIHSVIVTDVVVPILSFRSPKCPPAWRKMVAYGLAQAMAQLHSNGIIHGDWHLGNMGIAMPQLAHQNSKAVMQELSPHGLIVVLTYNHAKQTASLPAYLTSPCNVAAYYQKIAGSDPPQMKVFDFGSAHEIGTLPPSFQCALEACAPEVVNARFFEKIDNPPLDPPADVWALGATIYEIVTGSALFYGVGMEGLPFRMSKLAGCVPPHWKKWYARLSDKKITQADAKEWWASRWEMFRRRCEDEADANALVRLLKRVLVLDPTERPTAAQIVNDPWFQAESDTSVAAPVTNS